MTSHSRLALAVAALLAAACGASSPAATSGDPAGQSVVVATAPAETSLLPGGTLKFSAQVTGSADTTVTWSVDEAGGGTIDASGLYTAPSSEGTYHVRAEHAATATGGTGSLRVPADTTTSAKKGGGTSVVHVGKGGAQSVAVTLSPATATLDACKGQVFTASVTGASDATVTWTVTEAGGGTVTNGIYAAPQAAGTYHVVATSVADPTRTAEGTITVGPEKVLSVTAAPATSTVPVNGRLALAATVTTSCGTFAAQ